MKHAMLVIYVSENGRNGWKPVAPEHVPEWVKAPDVMGRLVAGEQCMDAKVGDRGSDWYRGEKVLTPLERALERLAKAKRDRKSAMRLH